MPTSFCEKCHKTMDEGQFYTYKNGTKTELCKKCLTMHIDNFDESTYVWLLEKMDVPYIPEEWGSLRDKAYAKANKDKARLNGMSVFGKYISKMKLKQWRDYSWADTEMLQARNAEKRAAAEKEKDELDSMYKEQLEAGEITEAQYRTLTSTQSQEENAAVIAGVPFLGDDNPYNENNFIDDSELPDPTAELTQADKIHLALKWGKLYTPTEWIALERDYKRMKESFDIQDADSENTLMLSCKTTLKANQAIDAGDIEGFQKLCKVSESLRKTAKFTAAQNKAEKGDFVDSIGQLIMICERDGFIPRYCTDIPQDKVDATLKDMNEYIHRLVTQDLGFGQQIEDSLKKIMLQNQMNEEAERRQEEEGDNYDPYAPEELTDADIIEYYNSIQEQVEEDQTRTTASEE